MKIIYRLGADAIWILHFLVVLIILFGWTTPSIWPLYMFVLASMLVSELMLSYCILSKWEFNLRKKANRALKYDFSYSSYYTYRLTQGRLSPWFLRHVGMGFTSASLFINLYFAYLFNPVL